MGKRCILLFVKYPEAGKVKTRLGVDIGMEEAAALYRQFAEDLLATVKKLHIPLIVCYSPKEKGIDCMKWLGAGPLYYAQSEGDLGTRLENAFYYAYSKGYQDVMVLGSDAPDLPVELLQDAFDRLDHSEVVIGPATDGGYYLLAFNRSGFFLDVFSGIPWSTDMVYVETWSKIRMAGKSCEVLEEWSDVDTTLDLEALWQRNQETCFKDSQTISWLREKKMFE